MYIIELSVYLLLIHVLQGHTQSGPDPWNYERKSPQLGDETNIPPDIRMPLERRLQTENKLGIGEWFFKRMLAVVLKGGQSKVHEDGSVDISLKMKFDQNQWQTLDACLKGDTPLSEEILRRTIGYVQDSIYKPFITEQILMAWDDYIQKYLAEYKTYITRTLGFLGAAAGLLWLWSRMSHKHLLIIVFITFYAYEVFISYKEAEKKELDQFLAAVDRCSWYFWKSTCEVPPPDLLVFLKHMNPLKICIRMFTTALAEPLVAFSSTIEVILKGVTDELWYPFDKIAHGILTVVVNISLIYFFIMILFNFILNIPFRFGSVLFGISIGQRERTIFSNNRTHEEPTRIQEGDRISQTTLNNILNICSLALSNNAQQGNGKAIPKPSLPSITERKAPSLHRSASTGRLPNLSSSFETNSVVLDHILRKNKRHDGSGDAH